MQRGIVNVFITDNPAIYSFEMCARESIKQPLGGNCQAISRKRRTCVVRLPPGRKTQEADTEQGFSSVPADCSWFRDLTTDTKFRKTPLPITNVAIGSALLGGIADRFTSRKRYPFDASLREVSTEEISIPIPLVGPRLRNGSLFHAAAFDTGRGR